MDKDGIMDMLVQYGLKLEEAALAGERARLATGTSYQANQAMREQSARNQADWYYQRISRELGE